MKAATIEPANGPTPKSPPLPRGWCWTTVGEVTINHDGRRVPVKSTDRANRSGAFPYYGASGIIDHVDGFLFDGEYLLIAEDGANLLSRSTPIAFRAAGRFWVNNHAHVVQTPGSMPLGYLQNYLNSLDLKFFVTGSAQPKLTQANLNRLSVPLAPVAEQLRIVAKIEELFSDLDAGVAALERVRANLKRYRAAVLKAAVEGRLTEEWRKQHPATEPAAKLLERILAERRAKWEQHQLRKFKEAGKTPPKGWKEKYEEPQAAGEWEGAHLPRTWTLASIDQLGVVVRGGSPRPAGDPKYFNGTHTPWITVGTLTADEGVYLHVVSEYLTEAGRERSRYIEPDTLLLTNSGATLGVPKITMIGGCINDGSVALLDVDYPLKLYLHFFLKSQTQRLRGLNQGAAQPNLNTGIVKAIVVPLPPSAEQAEIVAEVDRRLSVADAAATQVEHALQRAARLRQAILKRAFEGKLVPQDPSDESADRLLTRIRGGDLVAEPTGPKTAPRRRRSERVV